MHAHSIKAFCLGSSQRKYPRYLSFLCFPLLYVNSDLDSLVPNVYYEIATCECGCLPVLEASCT